MGKNPTLKPQMVPGAAEFPFVCSKREKKKKKGLIAGFTHSKCIYNYRTAKSFKKNSTFSYVVASQKKIAYLYYYFGLGVFYTEAVLLIKNTSMCVCGRERERKTEIERERESKQGNAELA